MLRWYQSKLNSRPLFTQAVTTAVLFATGDVVAQQVVERRGFAKHEVARTGRMFAYGGLIFGPVATTWFGFLARKVVLKNKKAEVAARVAADQLLFAPVMIQVFLRSMATMEGVSAQEKVDKSWWPALQANWMVWPFVQGINFTFVPLQYRVLAVNVVSIGWNCFLSIINSS